MNLYFIILVVFISVMLIIYFCLSKHNLEKFFPKPELDMASIAGVISQIIKTHAQIIIGSFVILVLTALLIENKISSEAAMPIISLITGYILGSEINTYKNKDKG
ncbi:MAG: hypothetical protein HY424_00250 [Candidatus Levybacteria bacterium]|nr:hypothetical protein [Candidatus Levybacteria bacterium]